MFVNFRKMLKSQDCDVNVLIIGAGAAGLMAAVSAADCGANVTVLEHKDEAGIKLALTGNGRCNYTNTDVSADKYHYDDNSDIIEIGDISNDAAFKNLSDSNCGIGKSSKNASCFIEKVLEQFGYEDCISFFRKLGIEPEIRHYGYDESGYVYPKGMNAAEFRDKLYQAALQRNVEFRFGISDAEISETVLKALAETGECSLSKADTKENAVREDGYDAVIIATGSNAYPMTGSDSSIYPVLKALGVRQRRFLPALCALYSKDERLKEMKGKRIKSEAVLTVSDDSAEIKSYNEYGEIQFNEHSISGIPVMQLSRYAAKALNEGRRVVLTIEGHDYEIHRTAGFDRAQTCTGGIPAEDIDPLSMRHKSGIFFCGEIIDIDGKCGGYNLHFAWATGYIAGRAAAAC